MWSCLVLGRSPPVPLIQSIEKVHTCMCCYTGNGKRIFMHMLLDSSAKLSEPLGRLSGPFESDA